MRTEHVIAQCRWQSSFDQPGGAHALQDFLSHWSSTVLGEELDRVFDRLCPPGRTWRIRNLTLELGDIALDELPEELPRRLRASLQEALDGMLARHDPARAHAGDNLQQFDEHGRLRELVAGFLQHGTMPWWLSGNLDPLRVFDSQLERAPDATIAVIRDVGRAEPVRRRLVWQAGEARVRRIVGLLEPLHGDFVCAYADGLFAAQARRQVPVAGSAGFRATAWLHILGFLLVDRGSLFNTIAFVQANVRAIAQHYRLDERVLLDHLHAAAVALEPMGLATPVFIQAIKAVHGQQRARALPAAAPVAPASDDRWEQFLSMLRYSRGRLALDGASVEVGRLFAVLGDEDAPRMAALLRQEGRSAAVRHGMLQHFSSSKLARVVRVLEPQDHLFIIAHAEHTQTLAERQRWSRRTVWQVLLAYLLVERGSHFSRRQLVHDTLQQVCRQRGYAYALFLDLLIQAVLAEHPTHHRFELLAILQELRGGVAQTRPAPGVDQDEWRGLLGYLQGARRARSDVAHRIVLGRLARQGALPALLRAPELRGVADGALAQRLLALAGPGAAHALPGLLEPAAGAVCGALVAALRRWHALGLVPSLDRIDLALQLPALLVQALPAFRHGRRGGAATFNLRSYWHSLAGVLRQPGGVDIGALAHELRACLDEDRDWSTGAGLAAWLPALLGHARRGPRVHAAQAQDAVSAPGAAPFAALRRQLAALAAGRRDPLPAREWEALWRQLDRGDAIANWIAAQPDRDHLLPLLGRLRHVGVVDAWLAARLPAGLGAPDDAIRQWSALLRAGGCWQGTSAVLERQLHDVFWTVALDARAQGLDAAQLLARVAVSACLRLGIRVSASFAACLKHLPLLGQSQWRKAVALIAAPAAPEETHAAAPAGARSSGAAPVFRQDQLGRYLDHARLAEAARHALRYGQPPAWLAGPLDVRRLLFDLFTLRPERARTLLAGLRHDSAAMFRVAQLVAFGWLADAMRAAAPARHADIALLEHLRDWLEQLDVPGTTAAQRQAVLFALVLERWLEGDWHGLAPDTLAPALLWRLMRELDAGRDTLRQTLEPRLHTVAERLRAPLAQALAEPGAAVQRAEAPAPVAPRPPPRPERRPDAVVERAAVPWTINNAGLVLLQGWIKPLFERLGLLEDGHLVSKAARRRAVHYLQFLVTGREETPEQFLLLNKVMCGLPWHEPVEQGIEMSEHERATCLSLLEYALGQWKEIGKSSVEGLRGNWLVREGSLSEGSERWNLIVEKRSYDVLLPFSPFSYSIFKLPWMEKAVYVTWPTP